MSGIGTALMRAQLRLLKPIISRFNLQIANEAQDKLGILVAKMYSREVDFIDYSFERFNACIAVPKQIQKKGVVLYLHGGGYTVGQLHYAVGFGSVLAKRLGMKIVCPAYRLAPEHPFPAALDDAMLTYKTMLDDGFSHDDISFCGESAGGGLVYALALALKRENLPLPKCLIGISPWCDLTMEGDSFAANLKKDPVLVKSRLEFYASLYAGHDDLRNPFVSPIFGDLTRLPPSLLFAGGHEIILSSVIGLYDALKAGNDATLAIGEKMWHVYPLYPVDEGRRALDTINEFIERYDHAQTEKSQMASS